MTVHQPYAVSLNGTKFSAIPRQSVTPQSTVNSDVHAGSPYPKSVTINAQKNQASASTRDLKIALGILGSDGVALSGGGAIFYQLKLDDVTGLPASGSVHRMLSIARGRAIPSRLTCQHQGDAELEFMVHALWDPQNPTTHPLVPSGSAAAPTGLAGDSRWTLKSAKVADITLDFNLNLSIDFGINLTTEGCNSDIWDRTIVIAEIKPIIRIRGKDVAKFLSSAIPLDGKRGEHADSEFVLRKRKQDSAGFADDDDITITAAGLAHWVTAHDAQGNQRTESELQIDCLHDGTNKPIVLSLVSEE